MLIILYLKYKKVKFVPKIQNKHIYKKQKIKERIKHIYLKKKKNKNNLTRTLILNIKINISQRKFT